MRHLNSLLVLLLVLSASGLSPEAIAQESAGGGDAEAVDEDTYEIPKAALQTEQGRFLASEMQSLLRTRSRLGSKHPTLPLVEARIAELRELLEPYRTVDPEPAPNPFDREREAGSSSSSSPAAVPSTGDAMQQRSTLPPASTTDSDLRVMLIELMRRVRTLELRVEKLERAMR